MSITKIGIKSFSLYKDCPTPYDYLACCCCQRYLLGLTTSYKALVKVFQRIVASNSSKYSFGISFLISQHFPTMHLYKVFVGFGFPRLQTILFLTKYIFEIVKSFEQRFQLTNYLRQRIPCRGILHCPIHSKHESILTVCLDSFSCSFDPISDLL